MKKLLVLLSLAFMVKAGSAQSKWSLGITAAPEIAYRSLSLGDNPEGAPAQSILNFREANEVPKFGYSAGFSVMYQYSPRWFFQSGLIYSNKGEKINNLPLVQSDSSITEARLKAVYSYHYLDIPLRASFVINPEAKLKYNVSAAVCANVFLTHTQKNRIKYSDGRTEISNAGVPMDAYPVSLSYWLGAGAARDIGERLSLQADILYKRSLLPINDSPIRGKLYSLGLSFGIFYKLRSEI